MRSYTEAAKECIAATDIVVKRCVIPLRVTTNYNDLGKLQYILAQDGIKIRDTLYEDNVIIIADVPIDEIEITEKRIVEATSARAGLLRDDAMYVIS